MVKDTIISAFNYDGTLLKWLKKVEDALKNASASEFRVNKKGNATISFSIVFANGDTLESGDIVLQQGESVTNATIRQGHLILTLSNGNELDAGDVGAVTGFSINASQHLIVTYQNGTTQDLGAIFTGNVNVDGNFTANSIIENMGIDYYFARYGSGLNNWTPIYAGAVKNGNKLTLVIFGTYLNESTIGAQSLCSFHVSSEVFNKLYPYTLGSDTTVLDTKVVHFYKNLTTYHEAIIEIEKGASNNITFALRPLTLEANTTYYFRAEVTFLLSDNLAQ